MASWSPRDVACWETGVDIRGRRCVDTPPAPGGAGCPGDSGEPQECENVCTTTAPSDCIYIPTADDLEASISEPIVYGDGTTAQLLPDGTVEFIFPDVRDITGVNVQGETLPDQLIVQTFNEADEPNEESPLNTDNTDTPLAEEDVKRIIISNPDGSIEPEDFTSIEVVACGESK